MRRRDFVTLLGSAAAWPLAARAQQAGKVYRIGFLGNDSSVVNETFLDELHASGFAEGKNLFIDWRFVEGRIDQFPDLATTLVRLQMDLIVGSSGPAVRALQEATKTIPIVMLNVADPVGSGFVASLAFPGGNITGVVQDISAEIAAKRLQLLRDAVPKVSKVAVSMNPDLAYNQTEWKVLELAAAPLGVKLQSFPVRRLSEFEGALDNMTRERADALFVVNNSLHFALRKDLTELALKRRLPVMSGWREFTEVGGLISYSATRPDAYRRAAMYVAKILKGARPADLPIELPSKFELVINLKTATALGLTIPRELLLVADELIE